MEQGIQIIPILVRHPKGPGVPIAFALTYQKDAETYSKYLEIILEATCHEWRPIGSMSDFELSFWDAITGVFPECMTLGCLFHMKQAVRRWLQSKSTICKII